MACRLDGAKPLSEPLLEYCSLGNKLQWNINRNSYIFIHENALENVVCKMASILSRPQCVHHVYTMNLEAVWKSPSLSTTSMVRLAFWVCLSSLPLGISVNVRIYCLSVCWLLHIHCTVMSLLEAPWANTSWWVLLFHDILGMTEVLIVCFDIWEF